MSWQSEKANVQQAINEFKEALDNATLMITVGKDTVYYGVKFDAEYFMEMLDEGMTYYHEGLRREVEEALYETLSPERR